MFITNESMQVLKAGKATVSGSYKVGQVVTFKCGDGSTQKAKCTHAFYANANLPVGEFEPVNRTAVENAVDLLQKEGLLVFENLDEAARCLEDNGFWVISDEITSPNELWDATVGRKAY